MSIVKLCLILLIVIASLPMRAQNFSPIIVNPFGLDEGQTFVSERVYFADIDGDGDLDNFSPSFGSMYFAKNIGNAQNPVFSNVVTNPFGLSSPTDFSGMDFVDIDNDGDLDIYQVNDQSLLFYENKGSATNPSFGRPEAIENVSNDLNTILGWNVTVDDLVPEAFISIDLVDIDNDGDQDLFAGGYSGNVLFFRNVGTRALPSFGPVQINPFGFSGFGTYQFAFPSFADIDNDGDQDGFVSTNGGLRFFRNTGSASNPSFSLQGTSFGLNVVGRSKIRFYDIDADGDIDALIRGSVTGDINSYVYFQRNLAVNPPAKTAQVISSFSAIPTQNGANYTITGLTGGASGNPIVFNSTNPNIATVSGNVITLKNVGVCKIIASQVGNAVYASANNVTQTLTVVDNPSKTPQTINGFNAIPYQPIAGVTYTITGVTGGVSGLPIVYTSSDESIATIAGNVITILRKGTVLITASQAGNQLFDAATSVTQTLTIGPPKTPQQINGFTTIPTLVVGQTYTITGVTGGASGNPIEFVSFNLNRATVSGNIITASGAGDVTILAYQTGNDNFEEASSEVTLTVVTGGLLAQTIRGFNPVPRQRAGQTYTISGVTGGASGNPVLFSIENIGEAIASISGNVVTFNKAGAVNIVASQAGNASYLPANKVRRTVIVTLDPAKGFQNITGFRLPPALAVGSNYTITGVTGGGSGNPIVYTSANPSLASISGNVLTALGVGTVTIYANQVGNASFNAANTKTLNMVINNATLMPQTILGFNPIPNLNIGDTYAITGVRGGGSGNPIVFTSSNPAIASISGNTITANTAGSVTITASQAGNTIYLPATSLSQSLSINPITGIEELVPDEQMLVYPNPSSNFVNIKFLVSNVPYKISVAIYNSVGLLVKQQDELPLTNDSYELDIQNLPGGLYLLNISTRKGDFKKKILINR